jgi:hypothetical protein
MPEIWQIEYHVMQGDEAVDWLNSRSDAFAAAQALGPTASIVKVTEYLSDKETIWTASPAEGED